MTSGLLILWTKMLGQSLVVFLLYFMLGFGMLGVWRLATQVARRLWRLDRLS